MRHLIIGYGNMGKRHAQTLQSLGDSVETIDLEWSPGMDYSPFDSVLITSPAQTHLGIIKDVAKITDPKPFFVEKPLVTAYWTPTEISHLNQVACNWRYCTCANLSEGEIDCAYHTDPSLAHLDMIHFLDVFWYNHGQPEFGGISKTAEGKISMTISGKGKMLDATIDPYSRRKYTRVNGREIHKKGPCEMFTKQMIEWRECVKYRLPHLNNVYVAAERTNWLLRKWNECQSSQR